MSKNVVIFDIVMLQNNLSKAKAKEFKKLSTKKGREEQGLFLAEGEKCVVDTIDSFEVENLICTPSWLERHPEAALKYSSEILLADSRGIEIISTHKSLPEVIAVLKIPSYDFKDVKTSQSDKSNYALLLDEIQDPGNLGTIIRTCDWFGIYEIYASENTVDVYSPKVVQATMGSLSRVRVVYTNLKEILEKNPGKKVIGTVLDGKPIHSVNFPDKAFIIMGNEGRGISSELKELIDIPMTIPPANPERHPDSLNVSVATAIILSQLPNT